MSIEQVKEIETRYAVERIRVGNHQVWPLIRFALWSNHLSDVEPIRTKSLNFSRIMELLIQFFYGFGFYFRKYDYLAFSDSSERKLIDGKWVDKSVDFILENLQHSLLIEIPLPTHYTKAKISTRFVASKLPLYGLEWIYSTFFLKGIKIENEHVIEQILKELNLGFDYRSVLKRNIAQYKIGSLLNKLYKPKGVVIQCAYTNTGFVKAFKDNGVKVIEVQHGLISSAHVAYNVFKKLDDSYFPDYFLSYGQRERDFFNDNNYYISKSKVIPVGHYYLDIINSSKLKQERLIPESAGYKRTVSVTGQLLPGIELKFINFIKTVAEQVPDVCFLYIPRNSYSDIFHQQNLPKNLINVFGRDTYEMIRLSSYHTTMYSTCAVEALALGTPNILVNIDNLAQQHLQDMLGQSESTTFVSSVEEYIETLNNFVPLEKDEIRERNSFLIQSNYQQNIINCKNILFKLQN